METSRYPSLYQVNTRVWLTELSQTLGRPATLDDIPDSELDRLAASGFDWIWLLSVWRTGPAAQQISRTNREWRHEFQETLPDLREEDIAGSGFAITGYTVQPYPAGMPVGSGQITFSPTTTAAASSGDGCSGTGPAPPPSSFFCFERIRRVKYSVAPSSPQ